MQHVPAGTLDSLRVFAAVAESGGFTAAAERLGMSKARVSICIRQLETQLGLALFSRTTRRVRLTEAGQALYAESAPALEALGEAMSRVGTLAQGLSGTLRVTAPVDHAMQSVTPALAEFAALHPQLRIALYTGDRIADLVAEGIDLAIRLGELRDSSLRALKLGSFEQYVVAAPAYLQRAGVPDHPSDLVAHEWIAFTLLRTPLTWAFQAADGASETVRTRSRIEVDSSASLRALLLCGAGISALDQFSVEAAMREGRLRRVLAAWRLPQGGVYAVLPPGRHVPAKVRAFIDFYRSYMARDAGRPLPAP